MNAIYCDNCTKPISPNDDNAYTESGGALCENCRPTPEPTSTRLGERTDYGTIIGEIMMQPSWATEPHKFYIVEIPGLWDEKKEHRFTMMVIHHSNI